jgi:hypothetical protein
MYQDTFQLSDLENGGDNGLSIKGANRLQYNGMKNNVLLNGRQFFIQHFSVVKK